jgi:sugar lactone lactonase YvrE
VVALLAAFSGWANVHAGQMLVAAANSSGDSVYELSHSSTTPLIGGILPLNTDAAKHGRFDALVWVPNNATGTLDLIVADSAKQQILRYAGPNYGTATILYSWSGQGHGPAQPDGLSIDAAGNLFVVSSSCALDGAPSLWVLPVNATGGYGAPVLIDRSFGGALTLKLSETVVAGATTRLWNSGDLLVLVGDTFDARVIVYSHQAIGGVLANPSRPLAGPTSTAIAWSQFLVNTAVPTGMDVWPADASHGTSLLITTIDGRILRFDTNNSAFTTPFATGLGFGLQRIKVGSFANTPYAFVAQGQGGGGQILEFAAPPASGANRSIASVSNGVNSPEGLAVTSSGSAPASACVAPNTCDLLGGALTHQISGPGAANVGGVVLEQSCIVANDPRVTVSGSSWSCNGLQTLDVANFCPGFPHTIIPGSLCGHAGPSGAGFAVIKATANGVDPVDNNSFVKTQSGLNAILPGPLNLSCVQVPVLAWAPRSDLPGIEGTIVEDALSPFFVDMTGFCDDGGANLRGLSMYALGLALNNTQSALTAGLPGFVNNKYSNLQSTVTHANIGATASGMLQTCVNQSQIDFNAGGYSCAAYQLSVCDAYVRSNLGAFSSNLNAAGGNPNPAGDIDGRLANLYLTINTRVAGNAANTTWPANNVPACVTLTAPATTTAGNAATLTWTAYGVPSGMCTLSSSDGHFNNTAVTANGSISTGALAVGPHTYTLSCPGAGATGKSSATIAVSAAAPVVITSFTASPPTVANGNSALLSWNVTGLPGASYCTLSATDGTFHTPNALEPATGSGVATGALTATGTYTATLTCPGATPKTATVTVQPAAAPVTINSFTATTPTPGPLANGAAANLVWSVSNLPTSASCTLSASDGLYHTAQTVGSSSPVGGASTGALYLTPTYAATLSCPSVNPVATLSVSVAVAAPTIAFSANPTSVLYNSASSLTWATTGVPSGSSCTLTASDGTYATATPVAANGANVSTGPLTITPSYTATLTCPVTGGSLQKTVTVPVTVPVALNNPAGLAFGSNGYLYVANTGSAQVLVYAPSGGQLIQQPSLTLNGPSSSVPFIQPVAVAFDAAGNLYVTDLANNGYGAGSVYVFDKSGAPIPSATITGVSSPTAVAIDSQGVVYVGTSGDSGTLNVYSYPSGFAGGPVAGPMWLGDSSTSYYFAIDALAFNGSGIVASVNLGEGGSEIEVFATGSPSTAGSLQSIIANDTLTATASTTNGVNYPSGFALDASQNLYVVQGGTVNQYSPSPALVPSTSFALGSIPGSGPAPTQYPALSAAGGVALDGAGRIYVSNTYDYVGNTYNNTIDVYNAGGVFQYEFLPLVSVGPPVLNAAGTQLIWSWTSLGEPGSAQCSLMDTINSPQSATEPPIGSDVTPYPSGSGYDAGTVTCPGALGSASLASY